MERLLNPTLVRLFIKLVTANSTFFLPEIPVFTIIQFFRLNQITNAFILGFKGPFTASKPQARLLELYNNSQQPIFYSENQKKFLKNAVKQR